MTQSMHARRTPARRAFQPEEPEGAGGGRTGGGAAGNLRKRVTFEQMGEKKWGGKR